MTTWLDEHVCLLKEIDSTWDLIKSKAAEHKNPKKVSIWLNHLIHIYEELKLQQNWDPSSSTRKKIIRFLRACFLLKPQYPSFSPIWTEKNPIWSFSSPVSCQTIYDFHLFVSGEDFWSVNATGYYKQEASESLLILRLLSHVAAFIDVGANVGFYSLLAAKASGGRLSVLAFEPEPQNYAKLQQAIQDNHLNIQPFPVAISSNSEPLKFYSSLSGSGGNTASPQKGANVSEHYQIVEALTLDAVQKKYLPQFLPVLVKIDVETFEYDVIIGANNWLKTSKAPIILFEAATVSPHSKKNHVHVIKKLNSHGYKVYPILSPSNGKSPLGKECSLFHCKSPTDNYLALPPWAFGLTELLQAPIDMRLFTRREHLQALLNFFKNSLNSLETA